MAFFSELVYSGLKTPDGTLLESKHRHDFVTHVDKNGKWYMLDGGLDYVRYTVNGDEELITLYLRDPIERIREHVKWGRNYDKDKNLLPKTQWIAIKDITDDHLEAILEHAGTTGKFRLLFLKEKQYRNLDMEGL